MAHDEPLHQDIRCLQIQLFLSLVLKDLMLWRREVLEPEEKKNIILKFVLVCSSNTGKSGMRFGRLKNVKVPLSLGNKWLFNEIC